MTLPVQSVLLPVPAAADGATGIPLTTIQGARPGPTLALIAGNHGYEYPPILALQRLRACQKASASRWGYSASGRLSLPS